MRALVLAGGFGTRLKELGVHTPKGLLKHKNKPLLEKLLDQVVNLSGIDQVGLVTNQRFYNQYQDFILEKFPNRQIGLANDGVNQPEERLGALGDLLYAVKTFDWPLDTELLVMPSDTYYAFSLKRFLQFYQQNPTFCTVLRSFNSKAEIANRLGCALVKADQIVSFVEKPIDPPSLLAAIPFYIYPRGGIKQIISWQQHGGSLDAPGSIIPWLLSQQILVRALIIDSPTLDVGTQEDISVLQQLP